MGVLYIGASLINFVFILVLNRVCPHLMGV